MKKEKKAVNDKLWGGRFSGQTDAEFFNFQRSLQYDYRLAEYDICHSLIHIHALLKAGLLNRKEHSALGSALLCLLKRVRAEGPAFILDAGGSNSMEDIHSYVQSFVEEKAGAAGLKLHTLRSRNDQIAFDERWYCLKEASSLSSLIGGLIDALLALARQYRGHYFLGYTHARRAQAVTFDVYLQAFADMLERDRERVDCLSGRLKIYIGAGALAGTSLGRKSYYSAVLETVSNNRSGKVSPAANTIDQVSDRDYIIELLSALATAQMHLSRMAEDLILYSGSEYLFIDLPEEFCTGSSLMPHKKNPDLLELVRGNTGRIYGSLIWMLTLMKGLPLSYNRDMQLDKEPLFAAVDTLKSELSLLARFIPGIKLISPSIERALKDKTLYATELAEWLVREQEVPFKRAHEIVGRLIKLAEGKEGGLDALSDSDLSSLHPELDRKALSLIMNPDYAVKSKDVTAARGKPRKRGQQGLPFVKC